MIDNDRYLTALKFVQKKHYGQKYGDELSYMTHLMGVSSVLFRFGVVDTDMHIIGLCHDVIEDTDAEYEDVVMLFGEEIAKDIGALSEPPGMTRKERHGYSYPRIAARARSLIIKLADRINHLENGGKKAQMYVKEHVHFKNMLFGNYMVKNGQYCDLLTRMWNHLDRLIIDTMPTKLEEATANV
jgi:(p)ppGpp synthase/HD superfamily hydrolase